MAKRVTHHSDEMLRLIGRALDGGALRTGFNTFHWNVAKRCSLPYTVFMNSKPGLDAQHRMEAVPPLYLDVDTPCRRCEACRRARASHWRGRALLETQRASRTWFGTFTLKAEMQDHYLHLSRHNSYRDGIDYDTLSVRDQFIARVAEINPELTKYLKRIRFEYQYPLRYLFVAEAHKSGNPHFHALVHQMEVDHILPKRLLEGQWLLGFTQFKLVISEQQAVYLCKYLSKDAAARVRASQSYGKELFNDNSLLRPMPQPQIKEGA